MVCVEGADRFTVRFAVVVASLPLEEVVAKATLLPVAVVNRPTQRASTLPLGMYTPMSSKVSPFQSPMRGSSPFEPKFPKPEMVFESNP